MKFKKVSVIISNYNKGNYIKDCIDSCYSQSYKNKEIIVLDNFSEDNSEEIIQQYKNIIFIKKKRISKYSALNQLNLIISGFKKSSGDIICLLDSDDYFLKFKIKTIVDYFNENPKEEIIYDIPIILDKNNYKNFNIKKKIHYFSIWPTIFPTSSISFTRAFLLKNIQYISNYKYSLLEIDFRLVVINFFINKKYTFLKKKLTVYRKTEFGIMYNSKKFSTIWWKKRLQAFKYLKYLFSSCGLEFKKGVDFYITKILNQIL